MKRFIFEAIFVGVLLISLILLCAAAAPRDKPIAGETSFGHFQGEWLGVILTNMDERGVMAGWESNRIGTMERFTPRYKIDGRVVSNYFARIKDGPNTGHFIKSSTNIWEIHQFFTLMNGKKVDLQEMFQRSPPK